MIGSLTAPPIVSREAGLSADNVKTEHLQSDGNIWRRIMRLLKLF